jgi:hypothetical protein
VCASYSSGSRQLHSSQRTIHCRPPLRSYLALIPYPKTVDLEEVRVSQDALMRYKGQLRPARHVLPRQLQVLVFGSLARRVQLDNMLYLVHKGTGFGAG